MKRQIGLGLLTLIIMLPISVSAFTSCRDTDRGCSIEQLLSLSNASYVSNEEKIVVLQELLQKLTALLAQLQTAGPSAQCLDIQNNLILGSKDSSTGGEVSKLQKFLGLQATGYYGNSTAEKVMLWQKAHGMDFVTLKSGVGPMTRAKMKCEGASTATIEKVAWQIVPANPSISDPNDFRKYEQMISIAVMPLGGSTKVYQLGKASGCLEYSLESTEGSKKILGEVKCNYALTGSNFTAYVQNGTFFVERSDESAKDGSATKTIVLEVSARGRR